MKNWTFSGYYLFDAIWVKKNGKWGKIDENNKVVTPFIYDKASDVK